MGLFSSKKSKDELNKKATGSSDQNLSEKPKTKRELIAEKYQQIEDRRQAIQEELKWLDNFNRKIKKHD